MQKSVLNKLRWLWVCIGLFFLSLLCCGCQSSPVERPNESSSIPEKETSVPASSLIEEIVPATCNSMGYTKYINSDGSSFLADFQSPFGHEFHEISHTDPNCLEAGTRTMRCLYCSTSYVQTTEPAVGHLDQIGIVSPTCQSSGYTAYTCKRCNRYYQDSYQAAIPHDYVPKVTAPSCLAKGFTTYTCTDCQDTYIADWTPLAKHAFTDSQVVPTCTTGGYVLHQCSVCQYAYRDQYENPIEHTYQTTLVEPTCEERGYSINQCKTCDYSLISDSVEPSGHDWQTLAQHPTSTTQGNCTTICSKCETESLRLQFSYLDTLKSLTAFHLESPLLGCDLSDYNGQVNFDLLSESGYSFVILKIGSSNGVDSLFDSYYSQAKNAGLLVGAYFYSYALTEAQALEDSNKALQWLDGRALDYPVFYDMEEESQELLGADTTTNMILTFVNKLIDQGYFAGLYTNKKWLAGLLDTERIQSNCCIWLASWTHSGEAEKDYRDLAVMWQYSSTGQLEAVPTEVDLDQCYVDLASFCNYYGFGLTQPARMEV